MRKLFGKSRKVKDLTYDIALEAMTADGDKVAQKQQPSRHTRSLLPQWLAPLCSRSARTPIGSNDAWTAKHSPRYGGDAFCVACHRAHYDRHGVLQEEQIGGIR